VAEEARIEGYPTGEHSARVRAWRVPTLRRSGAKADGTAAGLSIPDLVNEALAGLTTRPVRMVLTVMGTVIGLSALVATLGLSSTAANRIVGRFDELAATQVEITPKAAGLTDFPAALPWDAGERLARLTGVVAAGTLSTIDVGEALISTTPLTDPQRASRFKMDVVAASPSLFEAIRAQLRAGRFHDEGHSRRGDRVVVLGANAADKLGITRLDTTPAISIGDQTYVVAGVIESVARAHELLAAVIIPEGTARKEFHISSPAQVIAETRIGAAGLIARQAPIALQPNDPTGLKVASPEEPQRAREGVQSDLNTLFLLLGGVSLLVGAIGIANITLISVMERTSEIGLRRALGATSRDIAAQFLMESGTIGFVGGVIGASLGTLIVVVVAATRQWTPVLDAPIPLAAPFLGAIIGILAGIYPAIRAARLEPVEALRSGN
jgi:putative ABC transport system permease protein